MKNRKQFSFSDDVLEHMEKNRDNIDLSLAIENLYREKFMYEEGKGSRYCVLCHTTTADTFFNLRLCESCQQDSELLNKLKKKDDPEYKSNSLHRGT